MKPDDKKQVDQCLQPLRVTPGWLIGYNIFTEHDPSEQTCEYFFGEWLFGAVNAHDKLSIELTFEPEGDPHGHYILYFSEGSIGKGNRFDSSNEKVLRCVHTTSRLEVVALIEEFMSKRVSTLSVNHGTST